MKVTLLVFKALALACVCIFAQNADIPKIEDLVKIPPSPEAQAFSKYGNIPTNLYTGSPNISIPIFTLQGRELNIPIAMTYDASGIKVEQIATSVGLGWNLNVGGMITRQVNGLPDDFNYASPIYHPFYKQSIFEDYVFAQGFSPTEAIMYETGNVSRYFEFLKTVTNESIPEKYELRPDTYSFSALGLTGTFFIDYSSNTAHCVEHPDIKVTPIFFEDQWSKQIGGWEVIDASGNKYTFMQAERTYVYENDSYDGQRVYNSAWALTTITAANDRDVIQFTYNVLPAWSQEQLAGRSDTYSEFLSSICGTDGMILSISPTYTISQLELSNIMINGRLAAQFIAGPARSDLIGKNSLETIRVIGNSGETISQYVLSKSYFGSGSEKQLRLRLDSIQMFGDGLTNPLTYKFTYFDGLPSRESMAQDYWGFYNGKNDATTLIPYNYQFDKNNSGFQGVKRTPNFYFAQAGTIHTIEYPTGGSTEFTYEPHTLPPSAFSYEEEYLMASVNLFGGSDPYNTFDYCDDNSPIDPLGTETSFQVTQTNNYVLKLTGINSNPGGNPSNHFYFINLYFAGSGNTQAQTFCDWFNGASSEYYEYQGFTTGFSHELTLQLSPGYYRIMILNTNPALNIQAQVFGVTTVNASSFSGAGLRIRNMLDKDYNGTVLSNRYLYYGDLRALPPSNITEAYISTQGINTIGTVHAGLEYEEVRSFEKQDPDGGAYIIPCASYNRYSTNRRQSNYFITYPVVSEVLFDGSGNNQGFTVTRFQNNPESWSIIGFSKMYPHNGKVLSTRTYDKFGNVLRKEQNFYSTSEAGPGMVVSYFHPSSSNMKCLYVKSPVENPNQQYYIQEHGPFVLVNGSSVYQGCVFTLYATHATSIFSNQNEANVYKAYLESINAPDVVYYFDERTGQHVVGYRVYNLTFTHSFGAEYQKVPFLMPQYWLKLDSAVTVQYNGTDSILTYKRFLYENGDHFQLSSVRYKDSKGIIYTTKYHYPHEMQQLEPSNAVWQTMVTANRISEKVRTNNYMNGTAQLLTTENAVYKTVGIRVLPDKLQFSTGLNPLEDRVLFYNYDGYGNPLEVAKSDDAVTSMVYGYNNSLPIAQVKNATVSQVFYTSFEDSGEGNSTNGDSKTGSKSKTNGFSKSMSNLQAGTYILTYWQKSGGSWTLTTQEVIVAGTSYLISLTGQVDEVRFYPKGAQMTTYTYKPMVGITSANDHNNQISYYEYDEMNRLKLVRDSNGWIVKENKYNYSSSSQ